MASVRGLNPDNLRGWDVAPTRARNGVKHCGPLATIRNSSYCTLSQAKGKGKPTGLLRMFDLGMASLQSHHSSPIFLISAFFRPCFDAACLKCDVFQL